MVRSQLVEIVSAKVSDQREIVISLNSDENKIIIGQCISSLDEFNKPFKFFLKGAMNISVEAIVRLRDALNEAITVLENKNFL